MPIINIKFSTPAPDEEMKAKIAKKITDIMVQDLGKDPARVIISMEELPNDSIFLGNATSIAQIRKKVQK